MCLTKNSHVFCFEGVDGMRLDKAVSRYLDQHLSDERWTRSQVKHWIESGNVRVNAEPQLKAGFSLKYGDNIDFSIPLLTNDLSPYEIELDLLFEDDTLMVINKGAGIAMHPGAGNPDKTLANAIAAHLSAHGSSVMEGQRPGIVHRLDKDTTGLVVVAKTPQAHSALAEQFASRQSGRCYIALLLSTPRAKKTLDIAESGVIEGNIARHPSQRQLFSVVASGGKAAQTRWKVIERMHYASLMEVRITTGRTHQIRVHMAHLGSPVIGDKVYGDFSSLPTTLKQAANVFGRQALHAAVLEFNHPKTAERCTFCSEIPEDYKVLLERFRGFK